MLYSEKETLEDRVVQELILGETEIKPLYTAIREKYPQKITIQAIYKIINHLIDAGVVLKVGKKVNISREWADFTAQKLSSIQKLPHLSDGESLMYSFTSFAHLDAYWKHINAELQYIDPNYPGFYYTPHQFWVYVPERHESEVAFVENFKEKKRHAFYNIGGTTPFDRDFKLRYKHEYLQIDLNNELDLKRTNHVTIIENYIVITHISYGIAQEIDKAYEESTTEKDLIQRLTHIFKIGGKLKIKLEHNSRKAQKLRKKLSKNFYIPPELQERYRLF